MTPQKRTAIRGQGLTTQQLQLAPRYAYFIWCNERVFYPESLAIKLGRTDLHIEGPSFLDGSRHLGLEISTIIVDHAARLTQAQLLTLAEIRSRARWSQP